MDHPIARRATRHAALDLLVAVGLSACSLGGAPPGGIATAAPATDGPGLVTAASRSPIAPRTGSSAGSSHLSGTPSAPTSSPPARAPIADVPPEPPVLDPAPHPGPFAIDLHRDGAFVSQASVEWCVPAAILTMANLIDHGPPAASPRPTQRDLDRLARSLSSSRLVGAGSEPEGWAGALDRLGFGPYEVRSVSDRAEAIAVAARALRRTGRPVGLLIWRGAHAWVMSGFEATADPAWTDDFEVTHVRVEDPWFPRVSSIWGPAQPPGARISLDRLATDFLPWRRPTVRYPEKDGQFVLVLPGQLAPG